MGALPAPALTVSAPSELPAQEIVSVTIGVMLGGVGARIFTVRVPVQERASVTRKVYEPSVSPEAMESELTTICWALRQANA